jgi:hypothetical protein
MNRRIALLSVLLLLALACAGRSWNVALREDTAAGYARFLRENPRSEYAPEAKTRLAFVRARSKPSKKAWDSFQKRFEGHPLVDELRPYMEEVFLDQARAVGTAKAYEAFLAEFPSGSAAARARGNLAYLQAGSFAGDAAGLAQFVSEHPESDYAAEAERSLAAIEARGRGSFERVGLVIDVPASLPNADRLGRLFTERAVKIYRASRVPLVMLRGADDPRAAQVDALLVISHREREVQPRFDGEAAESVPSVLAETRLELQPRASETPTWSDTLKFRIPVTERRAGESALLHPRAWAEYWEGAFFVPVASWDTRKALRDPTGLGGESPPVAIEADGGRTIVLFNNGDFRLLDFSDPNAPVRLGDYKRPRDLAHFEGVVTLPAGIAVYGSDGIEIVAQGAKGPQRSKTYGRDKVGSIVGLERVHGGMVAAGNRGLLFLADDGAQRTLFPRPVFGLARRGERLLFTDGTSLFVASRKSLEGGRVEAELRLGRGFRPGAVRLNGSDAVVLGEPGLVWIDVRQPTQPRVVSRVEHVEVGAVRDAAVVGGRLYLLGGRGLLVSDASGERIVDSVDVETRERLGASGRHVFLIGDGKVQVVDTTAFRSVPASKSR